MEASSLLICQSHVPKVATILHGTYIQTVISLVNFYNCKELFERNHL